MKGNMNPSSITDNRGRLAHKCLSGDRRYMPGLDGLRALSVLAVIAYHFNFKWASGGLLGVGIFFVLSGYLITDQIVTQWKQNRRIDLRDFWIRRARRLLPAMFAMLAFVALWLALFDSSRLQALQGDIISVALYFHNWWLIFHDVSYFESFGPPSPNGHLWSLAIEEQFYVIWPVILILLFRIVPQRGKIVLLLLAGAAVSALAMGLIYEPGMDPSRVYYGTDTRVFALLIGAALAIVCPSQRMNGGISRKFRNLFDLAGGGGLIIIILMIGRTNEFGSFLYYGGFVFLSIISAIVIAVLAHPASRLARLMACKPLRWIGVRSYSLYIWHYPVIVLTGHSVENDAWGSFLILIQLGISILLAALSWKYIEEPIRHGLFGNLWRKISKKPRLKFHHLVVAILPIVLLSSSCKSNADSPVMVEPIPDAVIHNMEEHSGTAVQPEPPETPEPIASPNDQPNSEKEANLGITAIGDSVILDAAPYLEKYLPGIVIDGKVGRQMFQAQEVVDNLKTNGKLGSRVIIELGTNGSFNTKQLRELLSSLGDARQIVLVNTRVPRKWQDTVNSALKEAAKDFHNVTLVDWYTSSEGKKSYFYDDGVHLKREGAEFYASLIASAVQKES
ncbi:acetyltransferase [Paenibacillus hemerocallicola]|uniref:Acetyltransferase n=1 Tax=Paenibacillus hemerocallicola TaxID=1172614 RepID=A0A5C4T797_9BACL|nr:acyltransferase family protein [Paenibacillus hemerocallicola]TNJ64918.1 acetyltransferase [Paenibacillus hemerocallicola]